MSLCGKRDNILALAGSFVTGPMLLSVFLIVSHTSYKVTSAIRYFFLKKKKKQCFSGREMPSGRLAWGPKSKLQNPLSGRRDQTPTPVVP